MKSRTERFAGRDIIERFLIMQSLYNGLENAHVEDKNGTA